MLTAEDALDQEVIPRLRAAEANLARIRFLVSIKRDTNGDRMFLLGEDLEDLERAIIDWGDVGLVTIDPITAFMGYGRFDARRVTDVRSQLSPLKELAEEMNVAFSTMTHPPKSAGPRAIDHFIESQAFIAAGRIGHLEELDENKKETGRAQAALMADLMSSHNLAAMCSLGRCWRRSRRGCGRWVESRRG